MARIKTFDDWIDVMREWQKGIDVDPEIFQRVLGGYQLEAKYGDLKFDEIEFGDFAGDRKWEKVLDIPDQRMRDAVLNMIIYQGDTEFASNEQQKLLLGNADLRAAMGRNGREYVRQNYRWDVVLAKYERTFARIRGAR